MVRSAIINTVITSVLMVGLYFLIEGKKQRYAFVKLSSVYEGFQMKKDLEAKYNTIESSRKSMLDSLELELKLLTKKLDAQGNSISRSDMESFQLKRESYFTKKQQFEEDNNQVAAQYSEQVFKKINQYVEQYGKEKGYDLILGADGSGIVMHGKEEIDITDDVLVYINKQYTPLKK